MSLHIDITYFSQKILHKMFCLKCIDTDVVNDVTIPEDDERAPLHVECWPAWIEHRLVLQKNYPWTNATPDFSLCPHAANVHIYKYALQG